MRPPFFSIGYDGIAAWSRRLFHVGDTLGDTFCQGPWHWLVGPRYGGENGPTERAESEQTKPNSARPRMVAERSVAYFFADLRFL